MTEDKLVSAGWHWSYGILRRPELDKPYGFCYEMPDGDLVFCRKPNQNFAAYFACREDSKTGERYLCLDNKIPKSAYRDFNAR